MAIQNNFNMQLRAGITTLLGNDATGDIYYRDSNELLTRLPIGSGGEFLLTVGGLPEWDIPTVGGDLTGTILSPSVAARAITFSKIQAISTARLLGRNSAGSGNIEELDAATARALLALGTAALINIGTTSGTFPLLDSNGQFPVSVFPSLKSHEFVEVANQAARLALTTSQIQPGDRAYQTDTNEEYVLISADPSVSGNWRLTQDTSIPSAYITSGIISPDRLGSGTKNSSTLLFGDSVYRALGTLASFSWNVVSGTSQSMVANSGYITANAGLTTFTLPSTAAVGTPLRVAGNGAGGWRIAQGASQQIHCGNLSTTAGNGGRIDSLHFRDAIELVCVAANTTWLGVSSQGNLDII